ncbi:fungal-specific transcription factor domain-containing protein [Penicillium riverlandense]|uniref:fungal-specific transcription factor domain-containing protein n=1 Tax=Penicillium riverlandense TaxID=1903569 RepID=UPI002549124C|nr:fungal-specific transcription factor domain-containing protein [Penicillium riverlandense]KAJ5826413.1 fungal-specific transcription factor domain-containing protein [Penicillium riverlandense]
MTTVGAYAYSIETTEAISQVSTYFLQQRVDMRDQHDLGSWLTRFKELDLRLTHWKMLLPQKWKADMARQDSRMDPNLTLAHVSHNTSTILLHQPIAFPAPSWAFAARLPSASSADTCSAAAVEVAAIARNYLKTLPARLPVANLLAFCLFTAARALLIHWQYYPSAALAPEFPSLVECLDKMSRLWRGYDEGRLPSDLAGRYAQKLRDLQSRCVQEELYCIDPSGYTAEVSHLEQPPVQNSVPDILQRVHSVPNGQIPALESEYQTGTGDLNMISQMFLDPKFMDMDRIISFHDGMFNADDYAV